MNRSRLVLAALLATIAPRALTAQDQATTLLAAARSADVVVLATVVAATDPSPEWHRLQFRREQVLRGDIPQYFPLQEPAGRCCGRSLFALTVGDTRLLFLRRVGPTLHPFGGARGVLPVTPTLLTHVAALLAAPDDAARARLCAAALADPEPRIADDAAHALATLPTLQLSAPDRERVVTALVDAVQRGSTRAAPLADTATRLGDAASIDALLPLYLATPKADQAELLQRALRRAAPDLVATRLLLFASGEREPALRAARLLAALPAESARATMIVLLRREPSPQAKLHLCEGLLAAGVPRNDLAPLVPAPVLALAQQRQHRAPQFRNISPAR